MEEAQGNYSQEDESIGMGDDQILDQGSNFTSKIKVLGIA
jgi:hypothetical protein